MLLLVAEKITPRLRYTANLLLDTILGIEYKLYQPGDISGTEKKLPRLYYGIEAEDGNVSIPGSHFIRESGVDPVQVNLKGSPDYDIFFAHENFRGYTFDFDLFSAAFYIVARYDRWTHPAYDEYGRYNEKNEELFVRAYLDIPVVHHYAEMIWEKLKEKFPELKRKQNVFNYTITIDIDSPWLYKNKGTITNSAGVVKDIIKRDFHPVAQRLSILLGKVRDPYDSYVWIMNKIPKEHLHFFFLIDRNAPEDERYTYKNKAYGNLIRKIAGKGIGVGIHPSFSSFIDAERIEFESRQLSAIIGRKADSSRMHFLRYSMPETFRALIEAGIENDYSICPVTRPGFVHGMSVPFSWYDVEIDKATELILHPTMVMDRGLQKYNGVETDEATKLIQNIIEVTRAYHGHFVLLWHNSSLSNREEWKGWRAVFDKTVRYLRAK
ncbi:MAG: polysaccharide deacetylase family protein [Bacteroidota bacterium]|nr:polysaccharide deacetylase family protein [Bacteroidota bacterium]